MVRVPQPLSPIMGADYSRYPTPRVGLVAPRALFDPETGPLKAILARLCRLSRMIPSLYRDTGTSQSCGGTPLRASPSPPFDGTTYYQMISSFLKSSTCLRMARSVGRRSMLEAPKKPTIPGIFLRAMPTFSGSSNGPP